MNSPQSLSLSSSDTIITELNLYHFNTLAKGNAKRRPILHLSKVVHYVTHSGRTKSFQEFTDIYNSLSQSADGIGLDQVG
jgi:hypothetical protein